MVLSVVTSSLMEKEHISGFCTLLAVVWFARESHSSFIHYLKIFSYVIFYAKSESGRKICLARQDFEVS